MTQTYLGNNESGAVFDASHTYRYSLWRRWDLFGEQRLVAFIGLNPSTAGEFADDPTIRRCISFAKRWGFDGLVMLNLFAFRATNPRELKHARNPVGPENGQAMREVIPMCQQVICCWGANGGTTVPGDLRATLQDCGVSHYHLGLTKTGHPRHPLYLRSDTMPIRWG